MSRGSFLAASVVPPLAITCGIAALAARPTGNLGALAVTMAVGIVGAVAPTPTPDARPGVFPWRALAALTLGVGAFVVAGRLHPLSPAPLVLSALAASVAAAVAEELFFRKLLYGWLARWGTWVAICGAAAAFAAVHVPAYGVAALPVDFAAGVLFGWQRWVAGGWIVPGLTHASANLLQFLL